MFFQKKSEAESNQKLKLIDELLNKQRMDIDALENSLSILESNLKNLRGIVNRKLSYETEEQQEKKDLNTPGYKFL